MPTRNVKKFLDLLGYSPAPEKKGEEALAWIKNHAGRFGHFIDGEMILPEKREALNALNPATGATLATLSEATREDVNAAFASSEKAFSRWGKLSGYERQQYLYAIARAIQRHERLFAALESLNNGKPIREARGDVALVIRHFYHYAGWAPLVSERFPDYEPGGVIAAIIPWNFPLLMLAWKIAPAIAAGNTIVIKPAETTPLSAMLFAEILMNEVRLPTGVINIVNGSGKTGELLIRHPTPWKIAFTGSTEVGKKIRIATAGTHKHLTMELGGKSPFIVFADADLDAAIDGIRDAIFFNQGHVCCAGSRLLIEESVAPRFIERVKRMMSGLRIGDPLDKNTDIGAINSARQLEIIRRYAELGAKEGASVWQPETACPANGFYFPPTLCLNVPPTATIAREEIFGPVLVVHTFRTPSEAIRLANNTRYGLAASVWSEDVSKLFYVAARVRAGTIWNNCTNRFDANAGFGGYQESGYGREGGEEGLLAVLVEKSRTNRRTTKKIDAGAGGEVILLQSAAPDIDQTYRFLVGGKLKRPDGGTSFYLKSWDEKNTIAVIGDANRKDVRDAVRAARNAFPNWSALTAHQRAQIIYFLAENLIRDADRFARDLALQTGRTFADCLDEVSRSVERLFRSAALADKFEGRVHEVNDPTMQVIAQKEPVGVIGIRPPDHFPLLSLTSTLGPALAMGNTVVCVSGRYALSAMMFVKIIENSDIPGGVINIVASQNPDDRAIELASHEDVDSIWFFGDEKNLAAVHAATVSNMKRVFTHDQKHSDWLSVLGESDELFYEATNVKNIWTPFGVELSPTT